MVNEKYSYRTSKPTSIEQSQRALSVSRRSRLAANTVASLRFKRRDLKHVHLNAVEEKEKEYPNKEYEYEEYNKEKKRLPLKNNAAKNLRKELYGLHHDYQRHHRAQQHGQTLVHGPQQRHEANDESADRMTSRNHSNPYNEIKNDVTTPQDRGRSLDSPTKGMRQGQPSPERGESSHIKTMSQEQYSGTTPYESSPTTLRRRTRATAQPHSVSDRKKDRRLLGSDLYVARLGWKKQDDSCAQTPKLHVKDPVSKSYGTSRCLHDELRNPSPITQPAAVQTAEYAKAAHSRPCYRCIYYMRSAGIKRVFWTNSQGEWENAKVRDLVDTLESPERTVADGVNGKGAADGVFVTKHEVLRLRGIVGV